ncbi:unnamed protein product [Ceratitis capitata]|uniref:(Mediterranean fruit fly) hypothetical protein n=1 Tax=Ceratitis capitata TaxID=7213 RepID=A0A811UJ96_CERCA|nr:unnamed protein product [Ceratitis capitata]
MLQFHNHRHQQLSHQLNGSRHTSATHAMCERGSRERDRIQICFVRQTGDCCGRCLFEPSEEALVGVMVTVVLQYTARVFYI